MTFGVVYETEAKSEFREAIAYYDGETEGRGIRFVGKVDEVMVAVAAQPLRFPRTGRYSRKARVLGWPYSIYFTINPEHLEVKVLAIWHGARNPAELRRRLK